MLTHEENRVLTGVSPGTPLHEPLSRFWYPVLQSARLRDRHTHTVRLLGVDLVLARRGAELIALQERCPHRQCSLTLARIEDRGLRCIYHGWLIGDDGSILETPNERESGGRRMVRARAARAREAGGLIWLNLYDADSERAPFPDLPWMSLPAEHVAIAEVCTHTNWVQSLEGAIDSSHSNQLHSDEIKSAMASDGATLYGGAARALARPSNDRHPRIDVRDTDFGFVYAALRKPIKDSESTVYVRTSMFAFPCFVAFSLSPEVANIEMFVPMNEGSTRFFHVEYSPKAPIDRRNFFALMGLDPEKDIDADGYLHISRLPDWGQDRAAMAAGSSFCGLQGINRQDIVVQESMGPIVDRTQENLGAADRAIVHFRRLLLDTAKGQRAGAPGFAAGVHYGGLQACEGLSPIDQDWTRLYGEGQVNWRNKGSDIAA